MRHLLKAKSLAIIRAMHCFMRVNPTWILPSRRDESLVENTGKKYQHPAGMQLGGAACHGVNKIFKLMFFHPYGMVIHRMSVFYQALIPTGWQTRIRLVCMGQRPAPMILGFQPLAIFLP